MFIQRFCTFCLLLGLTACQLLPSQNDPDFLKEYGGIEYVFEMDEKEVLLQLIAKNDKRLSDILAKTDSLRQVAAIKQNYTNLFFQTFQNQYPDDKLPSLFTEKARLSVSNHLFYDKTSPKQSYPALDKIKSNTPDDTVKKIIQMYCEFALFKCFRSVMNRLDKMAIMQPSAQIEKDLYHIIVTIPLHPDNQNIQNLPKYLVQDQGIEIWETYTARELSEALVAAEKLYQSEKGKSFFAGFIPRQVVESEPILGYCLAQDTAAALQFLQSPKVKPLFPSDLIFQWSKNPTNPPNEDNAKQYYECIALKGNVDKQAVIDARSIVFAKTDNYDGRWVINFNFDQIGTKFWAKITDENIGKSLAILQNQVVLSYPSVQSRIEGGRCQISGNFSASEAKALADIINSGYLALKLSLISEKVVGKK
jgi:hypothetical protein